MANHELDVTLVVTHAWNPPGKFINRRTIRVAVTPKRVRALDRGGKFEPGISHEWHREDRRMVGRDPYRNYCFDIAPEDWERIDALPAK